ncbi:hypothetical protein [Rariglobus hedericola]|uniref:PilN domain-containing protein n=1 Tax=Rariglobus hedericola TaxID=2597822 RepID=A0A556QJP5_9BACT|nr:hypothetical protein [Rariglobus hedericola]TSJ76873.1 hypothetical protein FPL22_12200 [Rariglobus hedericola]
MRSVPVTEGATAAEVTAQAELAIEALAPFPLANLYYGHHWLAGATHALVYAAYRKRFTSDELDLWHDAEAVLPSFVTVLDKDKAPKPATAVIVPCVGGLTGLYFSDASGVPSQVRVESLSADATDIERAAVREGLLGSFPEKMHVIDAGADAQFDPASPQGEFIFRAGTIETHFEPADIAALDVRDKGDLAARRRAHARDVILWRTFLGCAAAIALCVLLELALVGSSIWQKQRLALEALQKPVVEGIITSDTLANRIEELSTKRLLPFEMLAVVNTVRPPAIQFMRTVTSGLYTLEVEAQTSSSGDIDVFRSALNKLPGCEKAEVQDPRSRDGVSTFRLVVTFKADAFKSGIENPADVPALEASKPAIPAAAPAVVPVEVKTPAVPETSQP